MDVRDKVVELLADAMQQNMGERREIDLHTPIAELGLDSLKLVEVIYELERDLSIEVEEELLAQLQCVGDVVAVVESARRGAVA